MFVILLLLKTALGNKIYLIFNLKIFIHMDYNKKMFT